MADERDELNPDADFTLADESEPDFELAATDGDFALAEETPPTDCAPAMRQSDQGLCFDPSESSDCYELQTSDGHWTGESNAGDYQSGAANSAKSVAPPKSDEGIYGLQAPSSPEPVAPKQGDVAPTPKAAGKTATKNKSKSKGKSRSMDAEQRNEGFSLEAIYARRFMKRSDADSDDKRAERPELPARPLTQRLFAPFLTPGFALRFGIVTLATTFLMTPCLYLFALKFSHGVVEAISADAKLGAFFAFFKCAWNDKFLLLLFSMIWTLLAVPHYFQLWLETASGSDEVDDWGGYDFVASSASFLWLLCILTIAGIPGAALFGLVGFSSWAGLVLSSAILAPFCLLSCIQSGGYFTIFSKDVARSVKKRPQLWLFLTSSTFAVFFALLALGTAALYRVVKFDKDASLSWLAAFGAALVFALISNIAASLYLRLLGRVAWVVDEDARARREEEAENAQRSENEKLDAYKDRVAAEDEERNS